jgi:GNAT superfamily N-acetyltransferase
MHTAVAPKREPEIRLANANDLDALLDLYTHLHSSETKPPIDEKVLKTWGQILTDPRISCFVLSENSKLVSTCLLDIVPNLTRGIRPFGVLQNVVTSTEARGRGLGAKLIREALKFAWANDCYQVLVQTGQPEAIPFYEKLGFRQDKVGLVMKPGSDAT